MMMMNVCRLQAVTNRLLQTFRWGFMAACKTLGFTFRRIISAATKLNHIIYTHLGPVNVTLLYLTSNSIFGFVLLRLLNRRPSVITDLDLLFTSVSAATVSSMSAVNMEKLSSGQLLVIALLMFFGSEMFVSIFHLHMLKTHLKFPAGAGAEGGGGGNNVMKQRSLTLLTLVVLGVIGATHLFGFLGILCYLSMVSERAKTVLRRKRIETSLYSFFVTISSLSNCGYVPTKEGMSLFRTDYGLLLLILPLVFAGNTLFPPCLRCALWILRWCSGEKTEEMEYLMSDNAGGELMFIHLLSKKKSWCLIYTVLGFVLVQVIICSFFLWHSEVLRGLSSTAKIVDILFQSVNSRHAGLSTFDLSEVPSAIAVMFIAMMYLPPCTTFYPFGEGSRKEATDEDDLDEEKVQMTGGNLKSLVMSNTAHIAIFIFLICITERRKLSNDPLNFNVLSITTEVVSAFGNVGFTMGYRCDRRLWAGGGGCTEDDDDMWVGFAGMWSTKGKVLLMFVMFFGRMKGFNTKGGWAWKFY